MSDESIRRLERAVRAGDRASVPDLLRQLERRGFPSELGLRDAVRESLLPLTRNRLLRTDWSPRLLPDLGFRIIRLFTLGELVRRFTNSKIAQHKGDIERWDTMLLDLEEIKSAFMADPDMTHEELADRLVAWDARHLGEIALGAPEDPGIRSQVEEDIRKDPEGELLGSIYRWEKREENARAEIRRLKRLRETIEVDKRIVIDTDRRERIAYEVDAAEPQRVEELMEWLDGWVNQRFGWPAPGAGRFGPPDLIEQFETANDPDSRNRGIEVQWTLLRGRRGYAVEARTTEYDASGSRVGPIRYWELPWRIA